VVSHEILSYFPLGDDFALQEMAIPDSWIGHSLREIDVRRRFDISVVAVKDMLTGTVAGIPDPDAPLKDSDTLFVAGGRGSLERAAKVK
jgi:trk system potassium uptake protein TrkA